MRTPTREESDDFSRAVLSAFHRELRDQTRRRYEPLDEPERLLAWFDDGRIVGTTAAYTRVLTAPGALVGCAAVTAVAVVPTHRRRGLLTGLMRRQLQDVRERGEPVAALWASEGGIYERFGYGMATRNARLIARRPAARLTRAASPKDPLRAGAAAEHLDAMRVLYEAVRPERAGMLDRPGAWWQERLHDAPDERDGAQPLQAVVADGGYAVYAVRPHRDENDAPAGEVRVRELIASTPEARATLWAFLVDQDLTTTIRWSMAPVDEPLWLMLRDPGAVRYAIEAGLWVRLVDVPAALAARTYATDPDVVLEVADAFCPWNAGRYRLAGGTCEPTTASPDLALDVSELGAAYLGGVTLCELAQAGRVRELRAGTVTRASAAFRGELAPWCPESF
ncbi:MAG TPA: GNAT family N-acetyltransferase [Solirubrobacteraceae bacterium]